MARNEISENDDVIDSRDVIKRIEDLTDERDYISEKADMHDNIDDQHACALELDEWDADYGPELASLKALQDECEGYADWTHGVTLIHDAYFEDYARQMAEDIGAIDGSEKWPMTCIDWEQAAEELRQDYSAVTFGASTYWMQG